MNPSGKIILLHLALFEQAQEWGLSGNCQHVQLVTVLVQELGWQNSTPAFTGWKNSYSIHGLILWAKSFQSEVILNYGIRISIKKVGTASIGRVPPLSLKDFRGKRTNIYPLCRPLNSRFLRPWFWVFISLSFNTNYKLTSNFLSLGQAVPRLLDLIPNSTFSLGCLGVSV